MLVCDFAPHFNSAILPAVVTRFCAFSGLTHTASSHCTHKFITPQTACGTTRNQGVSAAVLNHTFTAAVAGIISVNNPVPPAVALRNQVLCFALSASASSFV